MKLQQWNPRAVAAFAIHQVIATFGVLAAAPWILVLTSYLTRLFGRPLYMWKLHAILTETPYYPVQISLALLIGFTLGGLLAHRSMTWVWILPTAVLGAAMLWFLGHGQNIVWASPVISSTSIWSHYFGWGCQPKQRCIDRLIFTAPFYCAVAYSLGALAARGISK